MSEARTITLTGDLTTGGILVSSGVGNFLSTISGGNLRSPAAGSAQDLVIIQNNTANGLTIGSTILNNANGTNLVKSGAGTLELTASNNSYLGTTNVTGGVLKLSNATALPGGIGVAGGTSNILLRGGVIGLNTTSGDPNGDFVRGLGTTATQVQFTGSGGFAAYGSDRTVNLGGAATPSTVTWGSGNFVPVGFALILGAVDSNAMVEIKNNINLAESASPVQREIYVYDGVSSTNIDAKISGVLSTQAGITKNGAGTLELSATNTYGGATIINEGVLRVTGTNRAVTSTTQVAYFVNNGAKLQIAKSGIASHPYFVSNGTVEFDNSTVNGDITYSAQGLTLGGGIAGSTATVATGTGTMTLVDNVVYNGHFHNDAGATITGNLSLGGAPRTFTINNSTAAADDLTISAVISQSAGGGIVKEGNGTLKLTATNTYNGTTTVSAGTLLVSGSISGSTVTVNNGGTLGGGTTATPGVTGAVTVNSGGTLAPGSSIGTLNTGALALNSGSTFALEIGSSASDLVNVTGAATLTGNITLSIALTADPTDLLSYTIIDGTAALVNTGGTARFVYLGNSLDEGEIFTVNDNSFTQDFSITYAGDGGRDVILLAIPEPGTFASLFLGLGSLLGLQRFRRRRF